MENRNQHGTQSRISFLENEVRRWRALAQTDPLTGIYNRGYFDRLIDDVVEISKGESLHCGLIMFDIDHFKKINDTYGHTTGDVVLEEVSGLVHDVVREDDVLARYGGEEFVIVLISGVVISENRLHEIAEAIRTKVSELSFSSDDDSFGVTVSLGVGNYKIGENRKQFVSRVDKALYQAKKDGRNRVIVAE